MINSLIASITNIEIKDALFSIPNDKSLGLNGFTSYFLRGLGKL